jgi:type 1 fimbria pilin
VTFSNLAVPADASLGAVIGTVVMTTQINCNREGIVNVSDGSWSVYLSPTNIDLGASTFGTRNSPIPGIGIQWVNLNSHTGTSQTFSSDYLNNTNNQRGVALEGVTTFTDTFRLIKTGPILSTSTTDTITLGYQYRTSTTQASQGPLFNYTITIPPVKVAACSVASKALNVRLDRALKTDFTGGGSHSKSKDFAISLSHCDAGLNVSMSLSPGNAGSSNSALGLLTAENSSSASGLALQLMYNNAPIQLGTAFKVLGSTTAEGSSYEIPLAVRYYQTATEVTSGTVNSSATFTMTYN